MSQFQIPLWRQRTHAHTKKQNALRLTLSAAVSVGESHTTKHRCVLEGDIVVACPGMVQAGGQVDSSVGLSLALDVPKSSSLMKWSAVEMDGCLSMTRTV